MKFFILIKLFLILFQLNNIQSKLNKIKFQYKLYLPKQFLNASKQNYQSKLNYIQITLNSTLLTDTSLPTQLNNLHYLLNPNEIFIPLKNRKEIHITVITPPEFEILNKKGISIFWLNQLALGWFNTTPLQQIPFKVTCLGSAKKLINVNNNKINLNFKQKKFQKNKNIKMINNTIYYLVLTEYDNNNNNNNNYDYAPIKQIINYRKLVQRFFIKLGGNKLDFQPNHYYPHITLGFTVRDLFEQDGIIKDKNTCLNEVKVIEL